PLWWIGKAFERQGAAARRQCRWRAGRQREPQGGRVLGDRGRLWLRIHENWLKLGAVRAPSRAAENRISLVQNDTMNRRVSTIDPARRTPRPPHGAPSSGAASTGGRHDGQEGAGREQSDRTPQFPVGR